MTEKDEICNAIRQVYEELCYEHDSAMFGPNDVTDIEFRTNAEAERDELIERIKKL